MNRFSLLSTLLLGITLGSVVALTGTSHALMAIVDAVGTILMPISVNRLEVVGTILMPISVDRLEVVGTILMPIGVKGLEVVGTILMPIGVNL
jgi:hypothetical protein